MSETVTVWVSCRYCGHWLPIYSSVVDQNPKFPIKCNRCDQRNIFVMDDVFQEKPDVTTLVRTPDPAWVDELEEALLTL